MSRHVTSIKEARSQIGRDVQGLFPAIGSWTGTRYLPRAIESGETRFTCSGELSPTILTQTRIEGRTAMLKNSENLPCGEMWWIWRLASSSAPPSERSSLPWLPISSCHPSGCFLGNIDFANLFIVLKEGAKAAGPYASLAAAKAAGAVTINYGFFINTIISFLIVAFAVFLLVQSINRLKRQEEAPPPVPTTKECPYCHLQFPSRRRVVPYCTS